jgi:hypothetical protein
LSCKDCWDQHIHDGAPYPCPDCPEQLALDPPDRLALTVWGLLGSGTRPALALVAMDVVRQQLPDLSPGEWLGLVARLAMIDRMVPGPEERTAQLLEEMSARRGR